MGINSQTARSRATVGGVGPTQKVIGDFEGVNSVNTGATQQLLSFTVPNGKVFRLVYAETDGTNIADYAVFKDGEIIARRHTYFASGLSAFFEFSTGDNAGLQMDAGSVLSIQVTNNRPEPGDFSARYLGVLEDL